MKKRYKLIAFNETSFDTRIYTYVKDIRDDDDGTFVSTDWDKIMIVARTGQYGYTNFINPSQDNSTSIQPIIIITGHDDHAIEKFVLAAVREDHYLFNYELARSATRPLRFGPAYSNIIRFEMATFQEMIKKFL